jgi:hypothetical protein
MHTEQSSGHTERCDIVNHRVDYNYAKVISHVRVSVDNKSNQLADCPIEFEILPAFTGHDKTTLGVVRLNLKEYVEESEAFLEAAIRRHARLEAILALGRIAHDSVIRALGGRPSRYPFAHGARHEIDGICVFDSYHCSRYNTNTGRLTEAMFHQVFERVREALT